MVWLVRFMLVVAGSVAALFVARDTPSFGFIELIAAIILVAAVVGLLALWSYRRGPRSESKP